MSAATLCGVSDRPRDPLRIDAPDPGPDVTEATLRLLKAIGYRHDQLASDSMKLFLKAQAGALMSQDIRQAQLGVLAIAQLVRRIDAHAATYLEEQVIGGLRVASISLAAGGRSLNAASEAVVDAVSVIEGALEAAYIDGAARDGTTLHGGERHCGSCLAGN